MVKFIPYELTLGLRSKVLRNDRPLKECIFPTDQVDGAFHLANYEGDAITTIASFFPQQYKDLKGIGYQLRGMASDPVFAGKGYGSKLMKFAIGYIKEMNAGYIWCNARSTAVKFYHKLDFQTISDEFEIVGVGPHYEMILKLI